MASAPGDEPAGKLGVVVVAFNSAGVIAECLESLFGSDAADRLAVVVVDNDSTDNSVETVKAWASGAVPFTARSDCPIPIAPAPKPITLDTGRLTLLRTGVNGGFAYGVNRGIEHLAGRDDVFAFWVLNPDTIVPATTPGRLIAAAERAEFGLLSSRCLYYEYPDLIQTDGGRVNRKTGVCSSVNAGLSKVLPQPELASLDFLTGANLVVSRCYVDATGLMPEEYFLYYEEVDWAFRRGRLPLGLVPDAEVYHHGGTSIGSRSVFKRGSPFSAFFNHRNRLRFMKRHMPEHRPWALIWTLAKAAQVALQGSWAEARAIAAGAFQLSPPSFVTARIADPAAREHAFGKPIGS